MEPRFFKYLLLTAGILSKFNATNAPVNNSNARVIGE
ncbi:Uncharacterised protein [Legionella pneumophila]|nr:Uncharacterised protein [Legionella pneumophila]CZR32213.1 Uncharacterised protein [Legionella pneumophila]